MFEYQRSHPQKSPQLHSFLSYYLPTTLKILRAYAQLEQEGYVYSVSGRGTFVAEGGEQNRRRCGELCERLRPMLEELRSLGFTLEELAALWKEGEHHA